MIDDPAALAKAVFQDSKGKKPDRPGPVGVPAAVPASDGAYVDPASEDAPAGETVAAQSMIAAMKKGDAGAMARAMKDFISICYPSIAAAEAASKPEDE